MSVPDRRSQGDPMPETRDHREIVVAGTVRSTRPPAGRRRAPARADRSEWRVALHACASGIGRLCRNRPGGVVGSLVALGAVVVVSMNALGYQAGRHPAPILPKVAQRADAPRPVAEKPAEPAREAPRLAAKPADPRPAEGAKARDPIAELIRSEETTASVTPKPERPVLQAQRALAKLGYGPIKADGVLGTGTRAAIEKFERDRKLPVRGEPAGRTLRELVARAGLPPA